MPTKQQWRDYRRLSALGYDIFMVDPRDPANTVVAGWSQHRIVAALAALDRDARYPHGVTEPRTK